MKKYFAMILCAVVLMSGSRAFANTATTAAADDESKDMAELKTKLIKMKREMTSFMKELISTCSEDTVSPLEGFSQDIRVDVTENDKEFIVKADMPGMSKDRIDVVLENERMLRISGTRETMVKEEAPGVVRQERSLGRVERVLELPGEGMAKGITANYKDGVLEITIPKKELGKEAKIKVKVQ